MSYRAPNIRRHQVEALFAQAGQAVTWRQYVSAASGSPGAGLPGSAYYREQTITALLAPALLPEAQIPGGQIIAGEFPVVTRERIGRRDELVWRGSTLRVASEPLPAPLPGTWVAQVTRGSS